MILFLICYLGCESGELFQGLPLGFPLHVSTYTKDQCDSIIKSVNFIYALGDQENNHWIDLWA